MKEKKNKNILTWLNKNFKFLQKEISPEQKDSIRCGCNNMISSSTNLNQLERYFCHYWPLSCENGEAKDHCDEDINHNTTYCENLNNPEEHSIEDDDCDLNTSSLVLIIPVSKERSKSEKKCSKVYSVPSLKSPGLVLTLLR